MFQFLKKLSLPARIYMILGMIMLGVQLMVFAFMDGALSAIIPGAVGALLFVYVAIIAVLGLALMYLFALIINWLYKQNKMLGWGGLIFLLFGPAILGFFGYEKKNNMNQALFTSCNSNSDCPPEFTCMGGECVGGMKAVPQYIGDYCEWCRLAGFPTKACKNSGCPR